MMLSSLALALAAVAMPPDDAVFVPLFRTLVETDTSLESGDCGRAAALMGDALTGAGVPAGDVALVAAPGHPRETGLVARLPGTDPGRGALLLVAHIDTVAADRAEWRRDPFRLIEAELALVPSGGAMLDAAGRPVSIAIAAGEKTQVLFRIEATGVAGHASRPTPDNAIYLLAGALERLRGLTFPVTLSELARQQLRDEGADVETAALRPAWNALVRTTCAPTVIDTGRQANSIAARASAVVNCRLLPGTSVTEVERRLRAAVAGPGVSISAVPPVPRESVSPPPVPPATLATITRLARQIWPGVAVRRTLLTGATDARHFNAIGIPTYGLTLFFNDPDGNGVHAADERIRVSSVVEGRVYLDRLVRALTDTPD